ncbi:hypothetical protein VNO77_24522 [Canavalia gladiata]|uniref:Uncharacterized protein n=1 Tax=Canavalia gladiata TaxID=3824 RepID=A0AAN9QCP7_CANGL
MGGMVDHHHLPLNPNDWSMHDNKDAFVFPPINHENLQIPSHQTIPNSPPSSLSSSSSYSSSSLSSSSSSSSLPFDSQLRKGSDFIGWLSIGLQILRSKFLSTLSSFRNQRGAIWSFGVPTAALVMSCWVFVTMRKKKSKRRSLTANEARLINIIKEKDGVPNPYGLMNIAGLPTIHKTFDGVLHPLIEWVMEEVDLCIPCNYPPYVLLSGSLKYAFKLGAVLSYPIILRIGDSQPSIAACPYLKIAKLLHQIAEMNEILINRHKALAEKAVK